MPAKLAGVSGVGFRCRALIAATSAASCWPSPGTQCKITISPGTSGLPFQVSIFVPDMVALQPARAVRPPRAAATSTVWLKAPYGGRPRTGTWPSQRPSAVRAWAHWAVALARVILVR